MRLKGLYLGNFQAAVLEAAAKVYDAAALGCDSITGVQLIHTDGTGYDVDIQVSCDGKTFVRFALIDEAATVRAVSLGLGFPYMRIAITEGVNDMEIDLWASGAKF